MKTLSKADELVLLGVWRLGDNAYGVTIRNLIIEITGHDWSVGAIYDSLERLTDMGLLGVIHADPTPERGGKSKRYFRMTEEGLKALRHSREVHDAMWDGLSEPKFNG